MGFQSIPFEGIILARMHSESNMYINKYPLQAEATPCELETSADVYTELP